MTFFKVNDPNNRELIKEVIAKRSIIREADRRRKMGEAFEAEQLSRFFKPITKQVEKTEEKIEKGFKGLPGEIAKVLPRPINIMQPRRKKQPDPTYQDETESIKTDETDYIGEIAFSKFIKVREDGNYYYGNFPIKLKKSGLIEVKVNEKFEPFTNSPKIYEIFTNNITDITWDDLDEKEKADLGYLTVLSDIFYNQETGKKKKTVGNSKQWKNIFSHIWDERFRFMTPKMLESERTQKQIEQGKFKPRKIPEEIRKKIFKLTGKKIGKGLSKAEKSKTDNNDGQSMKKNYVTLPSDPTELVDRLTLLAGSKDAGNTGVYNEMVSICDELLKKKIIGKGQYKQFLSTIN